MADITLTVDNKQAIKALDELESRAGSLRTAFAAIAGSAAIAGFVKYSDVAGDLRNKLLSLGKSQEDVRRTFSRLQMVAKETRGDFGAIGDLYTRIERSTKSLGISQDDATTVTRALSQAMTASGMSAAEAAGPLLQLGQALQSGVFQGDELRSVLEGMPAVSRALADSLGVSVGALRQLGSEGVITSRVLIDAILQAAGKIDSEFSRTTATIGQSFTVLRTSLTGLVDGFNQATGAEKSISEGIISLADSINSLTELIRTNGETLKYWGGVLLDIVITLGSMFIIGRIIKLVVTFGTALKNMFSLASAGKNIFTGLGEKLGVAFNIGVQAFKKGFGSFKDTLQGSKNQVDKISTAISKIEMPAALGGSKYSQLLAKRFKQAVEPLSKIFSATIFGAVGTGVFAVVRNFDAIKEKAKAAWDYINQLFGNTPEPKIPDYDSGEVQRMAARAKAAAAAAKVDKQRIDLIQKFRAELSETVMDYRRGNEEQKKDLQLNIERLRYGEEYYNARKLEMDVRRNGENEINKLMAKQRELAADLKTDEAIRKAQNDAINATIKQIRTETEKQVIETAKLVSQTQQLEIMEKARLQTLEQQKVLREQLVKANEQRASAEFETAQMSRSPLEQMREQINRDAHRAALEAGEIFAATFVDHGDGLGVDQAERLKKGLDEIALKYQGIRNEQLANLEASRTWEHGWNTAFKQYIDNATNAANMARDTFNAITSNMSSAIDKFVDTGKFKFSDFARSVIADIIKIQLKAAATNLFSSVFGGGAPGGGGGGGGLFGGKIIPGFLAEGGQASANSPYIVGERGPELFVPRSAGTVIPNNQMGMGGGAQQNIINNNTYITNQVSAIDAKSVAQLFAENRRVLLGATEQARRELPSR